MKTMQEIIEQYEIKHGKLDDEVKKLALLIAEIFNNGNDNQLKTIRRLGAF